MLYAKKWVFVYEILSLCLLYNIIFYELASKSDSTMEPFKLKCLTGNRELTFLTEYCRYSDIDRRTKKEIRTSFKIKNRNLPLRLRMDRKGQLKENSSSSMDIDSITQAYYVVWCHIKSMIFFFQGRALVGCLRKATSLALFFTRFSVSQPWGWKCFGGGLSDQIVAALFFMTSWWLGENRG